MSVWKVRPRAEPYRRCGVSLYLAGFALVCSVLLAGRGLAMAAPAGRAPVQHAGAVKPSKGATPGPPAITPFEVHYNGAGTTLIDVRNGQFEYVWHTLKPGNQPPVQSIEAYDRHEYQARLTPEQLHTLATWVERHKVLSLAAVYPPTQPHTYGAAFVYRLSVVVGGREWSTKWDSTSKAPGPRRAADDLAAFCKALAEGRHPAKGIRGAAGDGKWTQAFEMDKAPAIGGWFGKTTRAEVEGGVLRVVDDSSEKGEGHCFQIEWEAGPRDESVVEARMRVVSAEGEAGVCLWVSDGVHEEGIEFATDRVTLAFSKLEHRLDTTKDLHVYRVAIRGDDLKLTVDGELAIDATGKFTHPAHEGRSQLSFGSASSAAKGESLWDYVRFRSPMKIQAGLKPPGAEQVTIFREKETYAVFPGVRHDPEADRISISFRAGGPRSHIDAKGARSVSMVSDDGGKTWRGGPMLPGPPFRGPNGRQIRVACKWWQEHPAAEREQLVKDGYLVRDVREGVVAICAGAYQTWSDDGGKTWERKDIPMPQLAFAASGMNSLQLTDGTILFPVYAGVKPDSPDTTWVLRSTDYGQTWSCTLVGAHPDGKTPLNEPEILELKGGRLLMVMRTGTGSDHLWQALSEDRGATWHGLRDTGVKGHPPDLLRLKDGRILLSYGHRHPPFGIRAVVSRDEGKTWDLKHVWSLRDDGGGTDLGYPHSVQLKDGTVVTVYYFFEPGGMQYIACTRWRVP